VNKKINKFIFIFMSSLLLVQVKQMLSQRLTS